MNANSACCWSERSRIDGTDFPFVQRRLVAALRLQNKRPTTNETMKGTRLGALSLVDKVWIGRALVGVVATVQGWVIVSVAIACRGIAVLVGG